VFRYKDVEQVLLDYATFSVDKSLPESFPSALGISDPPQHQRLRGLVSKVFTPRRIEELKPRLIQIVDELLELAMARRKMNVVTEFTYPLPMRVITEMLGLHRKIKNVFGNGLTNCWARCWGSGIQITPSFSTISQTC
jgi:cytochrome P450 family 109